MAAVRRHTHLRGVDRNLPAVIPGAAFHPPVALTVMNPQDGPEDCGIGRVPVLALPRVVEGGRVRGSSPSTTVGGVGTKDRFAGRATSDRGCRIGYRLVGARSSRGQSRRRGFLPDSRRSRRQRCRRCDPSESAAGDRRAPARSARSHRRTPRRSRATGQSAGPPWSTGLPSRAEGSPLRAAVQYQRVVAAARRCSGFVVTPQLSAA